MATAKWPDADKRTHIGKRIDRADGPVKSTGVAKYSYDINPPGLLYAKVVTSPHAHAKVLSVDTSDAESIAGVEGVWINDNLVGSQEQNALYIGQIVAAVAAKTEEIATEAAHRVKVKYEVLPHQVVDSDPQHFSPKDKPTIRNQGEVDAEFAKPEVITTSGEYSVPVITHCCLEPHGQVTELRDDALYVWPSTQNVSGYSGGLGESVGVPQNKIQVDCQYMGGGFGSKFNFDLWGTIGGVLSKKTGKPVKLMLDRDLELAIAGSRPSAFAKIKVGTNKEGVVTAIDTELCGTGGSGGYNPPPVPYVFNVPNQRFVGKGIRTNRGGQRAWRAPGHPQGCFLTMSAFEDAAAALKMDALQFFLKNLHLAPERLRDVYREELEIAAEMIDYKKKAHLRGDPAPGSTKRGLGIGLHTWGGLGHPSECDVTISPDGSVEAKIGTQDLGTGTRTTLAIVIAETLGLPLEAVDVKIGKSEYPPSRGSGGSTTIGGISTSSLKASTDALNVLLERVAPKLGVSADALEAREGKIREIAKPTNAIAWKDACRLLGPNQITKRGICVPNEAQKEGLISQQVGGVQIADVSVDIETGAVTLNQLVAVQDCGLIIDLKTTESQVYGALIMGAAYALYEEAVYDPTTGRMLNADMEFYRLSGLKDIGQLKVHLMSGKGYDERGVIGIGEPPAISPGAAIANAVANACGVRVPELPLTPDRVIAALQKGGLI